MKGFPTAPHGSPAVGGRGSCHRQGSNPAAPKTRRRPKREEPSSCPPQAPPLPGHLVCLLGSPEKVQVVAGPFYS